MPTSTVSTPVASQSSSLASCLPTPRTLLFPAISSGQSRLNVMGPERSVSRPSPDPLQPERTRVKRKSMNIYGFQRLLIVFSSPDYRDRVRIFIVRIPTGCNHKSFDFHG